MEARVPPDDGAWSPTSAGAAQAEIEHRSPDGTQHSPAGGIEDRLTAIEARLDALESTLEEAVAEGLRRAGDDMRRAVSELGRLLLRDLDRLTKVLAEHRDTIVERLSAEEPPTAAAAPSGPDEPEEGAAAEPPRLAGEAGRWTVFPRPRRRP